MHIYQNVFLCKNDQEPCLLRYERNVWSFFLLFYTTYRKHIVRAKNRCSHTVSEIFPQESHIYY